MVDMAHLTVTVGCEISSSCLWAAVGIWPWLRLMADSGSLKRRQKTIRKRRADVEHLPSPPTPKRSGCTGRIGNLRSRCGCCYLCSSRFIFALSQQTLSHALFTHIGLGILERTEIQDLGSPRYHYRATNSLSLFFIAESKKATPSFRSYYALITVGAIAFRVALDTASSDLWIHSSECTTKACSSVPRYPVSYQSPTYATVGNRTVPFVASYADGTGMLAFFEKHWLRIK